MLNRLESVELLIAKFLRYGVILAGAVLLIGWMMQIDFTQNVYTGFSHYSHEDLVQRLTAAWVGQDWSILVCYLGLTLLISLPFIRVLLTAIVFIIDKDYIMASCALLVVFGLILSVSLGFQI
jgi:uncharacterized membrane protein